MFRNRLYYHVKPLVPVNLRLAIRRRFALRKLELVKGIWPILPGSECQPLGWPGWPDGKTFALVLTHDVDGPRGVAKCQQLMELERELGFRSSFNFIPEGDYEVPSELRAELKARGFEVGVHDLNHDGKLYQSPAKFSENARRINHYLKEWEAVGFRSGFMFHNLDWLRQLNVSYESSTFDTDPFEPQPDCAGTIFPFWVSRHPTPAAPASGYVELPYTLPQDSTLFLVLRETSPEIWKQKLDWLASHGGMALVNVHPDYLRFEGDPASRSTFPVSFYRQFLEYARQKYGQTFWQPLPCELAEWYRREVPHSISGATGDAAVKGGGGDKILPPVLRGKHAAVVLYSKIKSDPRPRRELEALLAEGFSVDLICLQEGADDPVEEVRGQLRITRIPIRHERSKKSSYFQHYGIFFLQAFGVLSVRSFKRKYDLVHVHNMPDALVFTAIIPKWWGSKILLDLHDPMPELYESIYAMKPDAPMVKVLRKIEKWSTGFADLVLTPNEAFRKLFSSRSCPVDKVRIVMNTPDEKVFHPRLGQLTDATKPENKQGFRLMYHGLIAERHGLTTAVEALEKLAREMPDIVLDIYGEKNPFYCQIAEVIKTKKLEALVRYQGVRRLDDIPAAIWEADLGIIPNLRTPFTEINFPTRIFEYLCLGKPVVVPDTKGIRDYFDDTQILFFEPGNAGDLARVIRWVREHPVETATFVERGQKVYVEHLWSLERKQFINAVASLFQSQPQASSPH